MRTSFIVMLIAMFLAPFCFAETIILKAGQKIEGKIVERNNKYIMVNEEFIVNTEPTYFALGDIESIDGRKINVSSVDKNSGPPNIIIQRIKEKPYVVVIAVLIPILSLMLGLNFITMLVLSVVFLLYEIFFPNAGFIGGVIYSIAVTYFFINQWNKES